MKSFSFFGTLAPFAMLGGLTALSGVYGCGGEDYADEVTDSALDTSIDAADSTPGDTGTAETIESDTLVVTDSSDGGSDTTTADALPDVALDVPGIDSSVVDSSVDATMVDSTMLETAMVDSAMLETSVVDSSLEAEVLDAALDAPEVLDASEVLETGEAGSGMVPSLGAARSFAVLGGETVTNTGATSVNGNLGVWPGLAVTGFPPGLVTSGSIDRGGPTSEAAQASATTLYNELKGAPCTTVMTDVDLTGKVLPPGVYCFASSAAMSTVGTLTLDAKGDPNAFWIFQIGSTLTTPDSSAVTVIGGGSACNVFWQVGSSATLGKTNSFAGNIVAFSSITAQTGTAITGRALARTGAVTLDTNAIGFAVCP